MQPIKNYALAFLALTTVGTSVLAWRQYQELIVLRAGALDPKERADWQQRVWAAEKRGTDMEQQLDGAAESAEDLAAAPGAAPDSSPAAADASIRRAGRGGGQNRFAAMMERPDVQRLMALQHKSALDSRYAGLFKSLSLSPAQLDQLKNLLVEKTTATIDVLAAAREQGVNPRQNRDEFRQLVADAEADVDASIRDLLGETGFAQFKAYEQTQPQRTVVNQLEQRLSYSSTPLTPEQSAQVVRILAATQPGDTDGRTPAGWPPNSGGVSAVFAGRGQAPITDAAINQALGVLAAPQIEALRQLQQEQQAQAELSAAFRGQSRSDRGAAPAASGTTTPPPARGAGGG